mgnify:CR=1 FL=1
MVFASRQTNPANRILSIVWMPHETAEQNQIVGPQMGLQHHAMVCRFTFLCLIGQHLADWPFDPVL